ncbi:MAG: hypothetical protein VXW89_05180, partial [Candidatus Thermoplasmatota archaeon]|nr:hypothetical protein [Candidatus Thermoplasmatota archaeon]
MTQPRARVVWLLILIYAFSVASYASPVFSTQLESEPNFTSIGTPNKISVSAFHNATSTALNLEVPENEAVTGLNLSISPSVLHSNEIISWSGSND